MQNVPSELVKSKLYLITNKFVKLSQDDQLHNVSSGVFVFGDIENMYTARNKLHHGILSVECALPFSVLPLFVKLCLSQIF